MCRFLVGTNNFMRFFSFLGSSFRVAPSTPWVVELELYGIICGTMEDREWVPVWDSFVLPWVTGSLFLCFLSRFPHFPPNDHVSVHVYLHELLWFVEFVLGQQIHNLAHPSGLDPAARGPEARCVPPHPLIAWSLWINRCKSGCWETDPPAVLRFGFLKPKVKWRSEGPKTHRVTVSS